MIISEDLKVANMSKSASGTVGLSDRNLWEKTGLTRSLIDQGWHGLRRQLEYKQLWLGGQVLAINPSYTSTKCTCCGHIAEENRQTQSQFKCLECENSANAYFNDANDALATVYAALASG